MRLLVIALGDTLAISEADLAAKVVVGLHSTAALLLVGAAAANVAWVGDDGVGAAGFVYGACCA